MKSLNKRKLVVGCGSNVIDLFFPVRRLPNAGDKQYFALEQFCSGRLVGGVTLNHLSWARALGCPTGLMALQGNDENGIMIRKKLKEMGVDISHIRVSDDYATSISHILSSPDGERTIIMAPASTEKLTRDKMALEFGKVVSQSAAMSTTEISQVPLSGVRYLLEASHQAGIQSLLDVDVPPEVALGSAALGSKEDLIQCITSASVIKLTASAAPELLSLINPRAKLEASLDGMAKQLGEALKTKLCVITAGSQGASLALGEGSKVEPALVPVLPGIKQVDATGAGDAFFGGLIASLYHSGFPMTTQDLIRTGKVASAAGAACVEVLGALPLIGGGGGKGGNSGQRVLELASTEAQPLVEAAMALDGEMGLRGGSSSSARSSSNSFSHSISQDAAALVELSNTAQEAKYVEAAVALISSAHTSFTGSPANTTSVTGRHVYISGVGKSGLVAARLAASLRSIGVRASYIPGSEWNHGDLGTACKDDVLICFSHSGKTMELLDIAQRFRGLGGHVISITGQSSSPLAQVSDYHLLAKASNELLGLIPTRSIVVQEAIINGVLTEVARKIGFTMEDFQRSHPGGSMGKKAGEQ